MLILFSMEFRGEAKAEAPLRVSMIARVTYVRQDVVNDLIVVATTWSKEIIE